MKYVICVLMLCVGCSVNRSYTTEYRMTNIVSQRKIEREVATAEGHGKRKSDPLYETTVITFNDDERMLRATYYTVSGKIGRVGASYLGVWRMHNCDDKHILDRIFEEVPNSVGGRAICISQEEVK